MHLPCCALDIDEEEEEKDFIIEKKPSFKRIFEQDHDEFTDDDNDDNDDKPKNKTSAKQTVKV